MSGSPLDRLAKPAAPTASPTAGLHPCTRVWVTDESPPIVLDLIWKTGDRRGFPYTLVSMTSFTGGSITVDFSGRIVTLTGRNLEPLYELLLKQTVVAISEAGTHDGFPDHACVVTGITVTLPETEEGG